MLRRCFAVLAILLPVGLSAQRADTTAIPRELALALIAFNEYGGTAPQIVIGRVPENRVTGMVPRGARVLGGLLTSGRNGRSTTIMSMDEPPDSAGKVVGSQLERAGLKPAPAFETMRSGGGGFQVSTIGTGPGNMMHYCSDSSSVFASVMERDVRGSIVRLIASRSLRNTMCDSAMRDQVRQPRFEELEMPTLRPPAGMTGGATGMSGSSDARESTVRLTGTRTAAELLEHFAPQLRDQGWTLGNRVTDGDLSVLLARKTSSRGDSLYLLLMDARFALREHDMMLRVWRPSENR